MGTAKSMSELQTRREFVKAAALVSASALVLPAPPGAAAEAAAAKGAGASARSESSPYLAEAFPTGKIGKHQFSRLMLGGNLIAGFVHSRELGYVAMLARRYNTEAKILETLELAEARGINAINLCIETDLSFLQKHWKNGGKMQLLAQAFIEAEGGGLDQFQKAIDAGASGVHVQGLSAERHVRAGRLDLVARAVELVKSQGAAAGVAAHALEVIVACEKAKLDVDFYQKTLHTRDYFSAGKPEDPAETGPNDNYWCRNPREVIAFMAQVKKPWIAFKVLAAGAISPRMGFSYALKNGADFLLVGMFDWQVDEDARLARRMFSALDRSRPLYG